jgi:hypothetical protein
MLASIADVRASECIMLVSLAVGLGNSIADVRASECIMLVSIAVGLGLC